jgi:type II secretory pathway component GspD/PulD (secretin)
MVFIRPTILRDAIDASMVSTQKYRALQAEGERRAEEPIPLMKDSERPILPPLEPTESVEPTSE